MIVAAPEATADAATERARASLAQTRAALRLRLLPPAGAQRRTDGFPHSATLRWLLAAQTARRLDAGATIVRWLAPMPLGWLLNVLGKQLRRRPAGPVGAPADRRAASSNLRSTLI